MYVGNGLSISEIQKNMGNDVDMWELAKICGTWLKYLTNGLIHWEMN